MMLKAVSLAMLLLLPFLFTGIINRTKSFWAGRKGPPILQFFFDVRRLFQKGEVVSHTASFVFELAPVISFASVLLAGLLVPVVQGQSVLSFDGDFLLFSYILASGKFFSIIGAMDTGSSFEGMGASREALFSSLVEPAFFMMMGSLAVLAAGLSFQDMINLSRESDNMVMLISLLCILILFVMLLTEGCRVPVDDPNTHLELTMIHEVMVLDNSGPGFALMQYGAAMKMVILSSLMANFLIPATLDIYSFIGAFVFILLVTAFLVGTIESFMARLRMIHVPQFILLTGCVSFVLLSVISLFFYGSVQ